MASNPITSWQIDGETMETVTDFIFLGSKIAADGDCSREIKRHLFLGSSAVKNPPAIQEPQDTGVQSLVQEDPLEEGTATHSSILAWGRIQWREESGGLQSMGSQTVGHN